MDLITYWLYFLTVSRLLHNAAYLKPTPQVKAPSPLKLNAHVIVVNNIIIIISSLASYLKSFFLPVCWPHGTSKYSHNHV